MKVSDKVRKEIQDYIVSKGSPVVAYDIAMHLAPRWRTISSQNIVETCRWLGFTVIGMSVYGLDD